MIRTYLDDYRDHVTLSDAIPVKWKVVILLPLCALAGFIGVLEVRDGNIDAAWIAFAMAAVFPVHMTRLILRRLRERDEGD